MSAEAAFEVGRLYQPLKTIADQFSLAQADIFIRLPGLRGYWPMSIVNAVGQAVDHSDASTYLLRQGSPLFSYDGNAYVQMGVANDYLATSLGVLDITGTEAWMASGIRGLTVGGWFKIDVTPAGVGGLVSKDAISPNRGHYLGVNSSLLVTFSISATGTTQTFIQSSPITLGGWYFLVGRFTPSSEVAVFVNTTKAVNTTTVPAQVNVSTGNFEVGRFAGGDVYIIEGKARDVFICAAALDDQSIEQIRLASRP